MKDLADIANWRINGLPYGAQPSTEALKLFDSNWDNSSTGPNEGLMTPLNKIKSRIGSLAGTLITASTQIYHHPHTGKVGDYLTQIHGKGLKELAQELDSLAERIDPANKTLKETQLYGELGIEIDRQRNSFTAQRGTKSINGGIDSTGYDFTTELKPGYKQHTIRFQESEDKDTPREVILKSNANGRLDVKMKNYPGVNYDTSVPNNLKDPLVHSDGYEYEFSINPREV